MLRVGNDLVAWDLSPGSPYVQLRSVAICHNCTNKPPVRSAVALERFTHGALATHRRA